VIAAVLCTDSASKPRHGCHKTIQLDTRNGTSSASRAVTANSKSTSTNYGRICVAYTYCARHGECWPGFGGIWHTRETRALFRITPTTGSNRLAEATPLASPIARQCWTPVRARQSKTTAQGDGELLTFSTFAGCSHPAESSRASDARRAVHRSPPYAASRRLCLTFKSVHHRRPSYSGTPAHVVAAHAGASCHVPVMCLPWRPLAGIVPRLARSPNSRTFSNNATTRSRRPD
jgi:hypothetical protein